MSEKETPGTLPTNFTDEGYARFEAAWLARRNGDPLPAWQDYLPAPDAPCSTDLVLMLLKVDIECRIKAGLAGLLAERYFEHPRLNEADARLDAEQQIELIQWEYEQRWRNGQQPRRAEYEAAFPQHADAIRELKPHSRCPKCQQLIPLDETWQTFVCPVCDDAASVLDVSSTAVNDLDPRRYELMEELGKGGMGEVYRCCDPCLGRNLAIKVMKAEFQNHPEVERRFLREARVTGSLQHPGIVAVYNLGRLPDGRLNYTMRLVRGRTFAEILEDEAGKPERLPSLLAIFEKVCEAVAYAHSKRVIHRDLKPANIMLGKFGEVQVMDWGLAKLLTSEGEPADEEPRLETDGTWIHTETPDTPSDLTRAGSGIGTPAYMPPEQAQGDWDLVDERADVFALGAILCLMLTGQPLNSGVDSNELLRRARRGDLAEALSRLEKSGADEALSALCRECLAVNCEQRLQNAGVLARRLAEYQTAVEQRVQQAELKRTEAEVKSREERKRRRLALSFSSTVLLVVIAGAIISVQFAIDARSQAERALGNERKAEEALAETRSAYELSLENLPYVGHFLNDLGQYADAEQVFREALEVAKKRFPSDMYPKGHLHLAKGYANLARTLEVQGKPQEAAEAFDKSIHIMRAIGSREPGHFLEMRVTHFPTVYKGRRLVGIIGQSSFSAKESDSVTVDAKLSRPMYAYLMALRPDGKIELCFPQDERQVPELTDQPRYPSVSNGFSYGLEEGVGLMVFAVVATDEPLPSFKEWIAHKKIEWKRHPGQPGVVFFDNGEPSTLENALEGSNEPSRIHRQSDSKDIIKRLTSRLRVAGKTDTVGAIAFTVVPKP